MSFTLKLDSSDLGSQTSDNFTINFGEPIVLNTNTSNQDKYEIALISADCWNSYFNISSELANNTLRYYNGTDWKNLTLPNGNYQVTDLNDFVQVKMDENNDSNIDPDGGPTTYDIIIAPNVVTQKVEIALTNGFKIDLSTSKLNELIGFNSGIYDTNVSSQNRVDITRGVNSLVIHCSIAGGSYDNSLGSDILYSFVPQTPRGSAIHVEPNYPIYLPVNEANYIKRINMRITDQLGRRVNFNGEDVTYFLHMRKAMQ